MKMVFIGLSLSSSWGNGHATTFRALLRALQARGHELHFLERDMPWYAENRDLPTPDFCQLSFYDSLEDFDRFARLVAEADAAIIGSYVPDGPQVCAKVLKWAGSFTAFYDIDTPVTLELLAEGKCEYLLAEHIPAFDAYLSFSGGRALDILRAEYGAVRPEAFFCSADPGRYHPAEDATERWALGYLGTWSADRQPALEKLLISPARLAADRHFVVAGSMYPPEVTWPRNVARINHLAPADHASFYAQQGWTLNITREAMVRLGHSPSVRLFEAAACGVPVISDRWEGLEEFFTPDEDILVAESTEEVIHLLSTTTDLHRRAIGARARKKFLSAHTPRHRAEQLENIIGPCRREMAVDPLLSEVSFL